VRATGEGKNSRVMERVVAYLRETAEVQGVTLPPETESLIEAGVLDSFGVLEFVTMIEQEMNIKIPEDDLVPSNFETIAKINEYVNGRFEE